MAKRKTANKKPLIVTLAVILFIIATISAVWLIYSNSVVAHMRSVAHQFTPDGSWQLQHEHSVPPTPFCLHDEPCPYYLRTWKFNKSLSKQELNDKLASIGWPTAKDEDCAPNPKATGYRIACDIVFKRDSYTVEVIYITDYSNSTKNELEVTVQ